MSTSFCGCTFRLELHDISILALDIHWSKIFFLNLRRKGIIPNIDVLTSHHVPISCKLQITLFIWISELISAYNVPNSPGSLCGVFCDIQMKSRIFHDNFKKWVLLVYMMANCYILQYIKVLLEKPSQGKLNPTTPICNADVATNFQGKRILILYLFIVLRVYLLIYSLY